MSLKYAQLQPFTLFGAGASIGDTSIVLSSFQTIDGVNLTMTDFGDKAFATIEPNAGTQEEQISFTGVTQNSNGTATLTGVKHVLFVSPYTETSGLTKGHAGGVNLDISNTSGFYNTFVNTANDQTITGDWTFTNHSPTIPTELSSEVNRAASIEYVNNIALSGAPNASETVKGISQLATNAQMGTGTSTGSTGARLVPPNDQLVKTSSGAADQNKIPVLNASGQLAAGFVLIDTARSWSTLQNFPAGTISITAGSTAAGTPVTRSSFFGDASDGAFAQSSGTTTLNTASKYVYQYSSFALTGTADLTTGANLKNFPVFILVQGDLTITSSASPAVNFKGRGATGGTAGLHGAAGGAGGNGGTNPNRITETAAVGAVSPGGGGAAGGGGGGGAGYGNSGLPGAAGDSAGGTAGSLEIYSISGALSRFLSVAHIGGGGSGGAGGDNGGGTGADGGAGGDGGGNIIFIVGGNINLTSAMSVAGNNGSAGTAGVGGGFASGGGGGGGGGFLGVFYAGSVTANSSVISAGGGSGGAAGTGANAGGAGGAGGDGTSLVRLIKGFIYM